MKNHWKYHDGVWYAKQNEYFTHGRSPPDNVRCPGCHQITYPYTWTSWQPANIKSSDIIGIHNCGTKIYLERL
jgi:hypothetical protein